MNARSRPVAEILAPRGDVSDWECSGSGGLGPLVELCLRGAWLTTRFVDSIAQVSSIEWPLSQLNFVSGDCGCAATAVLDESRRFEAHQSDVVKVLAEFTTLSAWNCDKGAGLILRACYSIDEGGCNCGCRVTV